ncbi:NTPase KAP family P-loop domain-containing protein 1 [Trichomycterus rosablanca]|uniref:NTPase KAP family P-loop domain-containing protein 1 n=1 Tax=Trichomycterus rosablanca TaxID=2290929 RepID=UPI002F354175
MPAIAKTLLMLVGTIDLKQQSWRRDIVHVCCIRKATELLMMARDVSSDHVYAYALYKTLTEVDSPITVGLYSSCHSRIKMILKSIKGYMDEEAKTKNQNSKGSNNIGSLISLIFRLLFYRPVWTVKKQSWDCPRYVFVSFSAWHFAGSDMLWAGLVMQLCQSLQDSFGRLQLSLFRVAQYDPRKDSRKKKIEVSSNDWRSKKFCCCPLWALVLMLLMVSLFVLVPIIIIEFSSRKHEEDMGIDESHAVLDTFAIAMLGLPAAGAVRFIFMLVKNLIFNQDANVRKALDNNKVSEQLGLMHEIRKEMRLLSCFIHFMELFEQRRIRVMLEITNLDRCTPTKIVGVLDAINILLSDEESPFISLVAIDPEVLAQKVDQADGCFSKNDQAYGFLDRIITLPFTVPTLCNESKCQVFENITEGRSAMLSGAQNEVLDSPYIKTTPSVERDSLLESNPHEEVYESSFGQSNTHPHSYNKNKVESLIQDAFRSIFLHNQSKLQTYISENTVSMRRVINSIRVSIVVREALLGDVPHPESVAAWIVLVDRWPCRLSWILQCAEDEHQTVQSSESEIDFDHSKTLWNVFTEHRFELHVIRNEVEKFLERDDDPELFEIFLKKDYKFTVWEAYNFMKYTVNLDHSIKNELARIRQSNTVRGTGRSTFKNLSQRMLFSMTVEDVCNELSKLGLPEKYSEIVKKNHLNGQTLLIADPADLKEVMQMTLGEWTSFTIHFLGVMSGYRMNVPKSEPVISNTNVVDRNGR